jgi:hypothetical protein
MGDLRPTRFAAVIVALAAGLVLLGAATAPNAEDITRNGAGVADAGKKARFDCKMCRKPSQITASSVIVPVHGPVTPFVKLDG